MDIFSALNIGVTGVLAPSDSINTISQNISNANTVGYKEGVTTFADILSDTSGNNYSVNGNGAPDVGYSPGGVMSEDTQLNIVQGNLTPTTSPTDIAISGPGFFVVSPTATNSTSNLAYTRAGSFTADKNGNYANAAGEYLQAWPVDADGNLPSGITGPTVASDAGTAVLQTVNIQKIIETPIPTSTVSVQANLDALQTTYAGSPAYNAANAADNMASGSVQPDFTVPVTVVDSAGNNHNLDVGFLKTGTNSWSVEIYGNPGSDILSASGQLTAGQVATGTVTFNTDGTLASISPALTQPNIVWSAAGTTTSAIAFNWGTAGAIGTGQSNGLSQFAAANDLEGVQQNGIQANTSTTTSVSSTGVISVTYSNGTTRPLYQIPLAEFPNPDQLNALSDNVYTSSTSAGALTFLAPNQNYNVSISSNALEESNVDLATQLTNMIIAQNAYQSNTKLISTSDEMLQTAVQMDQSISI